MTGTAITVAQTRSTSPAARGRLTARTVPVASVEPNTLDAAFELFRQSYDGADRSRFDRDFAKKQLVVLLTDRADGMLKGFSTVHLETVNGRTVVFSGDTVIDRAYWGQKLLQTQFARLLLSLKLRAPHRPLYWFLISKGWRTYILLANAFPRAVPRSDRPDDMKLRDVLDALATARFGSQYDSRTGIIRYATPHERVRDGIAPVPETLSRNHHVRFFLERNPGHSEGDELACLAEIRLIDLARVGGRIVSDRLKRLRNGFNGLNRSGTGVRVPDPSNPAHLSPS